MDQQNLYVVKTMAPTGYFKKTQEIRKLEKIFIKSLI